MVGVWAQFCEVVADAPVPTLGLRGRLVDVGIGVADKEGHGTGTLGYGGFWGGGDRRAYSVDQSTRSSSSPRSVVLSGGMRAIRRERKNNMKRAKLRHEGRKEKVEVGQIQSGHKPYLESSHDGVWTLVRFPYPPHPLRPRSAWTLPTALLASPRLLGSWAAPTSAFNAYFPHQSTMAREAPGPANEVTARRRWT